MSLLFSEKAVLLCEKLSLIREKLVSERWQYDKISVPLPSKGTRLHGISLLHQYRPTLALPQKVFLTFTC